MIYLILLILIVLGWGYVVSVYNSIIKSKNSVQEAKGSIETVLQNRLDLIPNLVDVVKEYTDHEKSTLTEVTKMRSELMSADWVSKERMQKENQLTWTLKSLFALSENYPDLKANENFLNLQEQWKQIEQKLQQARQTYNLTVKSFWDEIQTFPNQIIANQMNLPEYEMYEAEQQANQAPDAKDLFNS